MSESSAKSERESIPTESDVNDEMLKVKPEMMKRERERKRARRVRARDDADLSGAILNPLCDQNLSSYETRIDLSLFLSSLKGFKARERGTRERRARCFGENDFVFRRSL